MPIGTAHDNPILDTRVYEVEFPDGHRASLSANAIAENLFAQVDDEGNRRVLFDEVDAHRTNGKEVLMADAFVTTSRGTKRRKETTQGWELLIIWKDGSPTWVTLKDMKEAYCETVGSMGIHSMVVERRGVRRSSVSVNGDEVRTVI